MTGAYTLDDPRPIASEAPYTFFLPSAEALAALAKGDIVKLIFRPAGWDRKWGAERMWVSIDRIDGDQLEGTLDNVPEDIPGLALGDRIRFERHHVIRCWREDERDPEPPLPSLRREYWERCLVDACVIADGVRVHYLYREAPEPAEEGEEHPDSGWRIRGDYRGVTDGEMDERNVACVALGAVLNVDDSWLNLIDAPVGSAFVRDWETDDFIPVEREC